MTFIWHLPACLREAASAKAGILKFGIALKRHKVGKESMKTYINEIKENDQVESLFLVREKSFRITKTGNTYLKLKLLDRSGEIEGRIWTSAENFGESFEKDDFVQVMGKAVSFQEHLQLNITHVQRVGEEEILFSDFFPMAEKDIEEMVKEWRSEKK